MIDSKININDHNGTISSGMCWIGLEIFDPGSGFNNTGVPKFVFWSRMLEWINNWPDCIEYEDKEEAMKDYAHILRRSNYFQTENNRLASDQKYVDFKTIKLVNVETTFKHVINHDDIADELQFIRRAELLKGIIPEAAIEDLNLEEIAVFHKLSNDLDDENNDLSPF